MNNVFRFIIILLISSCAGGGIGNVQIYQFNASRTNLRNAIDKLYDNHLIIKPKPTLMFTYEDDQSSENCLIIYKNDSIVFNYELTEVENQPNKSLLILLGCGKYGEVIELPSYITVDMINYFRDIFTKEIVNKLPFVPECVFS